MTTNTPRPRISTAQRLRRIAAWAGVAVLALVVLVVLALSLPSVRGRILREAIVRADAALPGTVAIEQASWPSPGTIDLGNMLWTDEGDTLAVAAGLRVSFRLRPLFRRDVDVESIELKGARADIPAISARVARIDTTPDTPATADSSGGTFPREGSLAGLPSIAVHRLVLTADSIRVGENDVLTGIDLAASVDLLRGHKPSAHIERLAVHGRARAWGIEDMDIAIDLAQGRVEGRIDGRAGPHWPFLVVLSSDGPDRYVIDASLRDSGSFSADAGVRVALDVERDGLHVERIHIGADIRTPGIEVLSAHPDLATALASAPPLEGIVARIDADLDMTSTPAVAATLSIEENAWLKGLRVVATYRDGVADVSDARIALDGLEIQAQARAGSDSLSGAASIGATSGVWLSHLRPDAGPPPALNARVDVEIGGALPLEKVALKILADAAGTYAGLSAEIQRGETIAVDLSPVMVRTRRLSDAPSLGSSPGAIRMSPSGEVSASGLRVTGDFGQARIDADIDDQGQGTATVAAQWPTLPAPLVAALKLEPARADSLRVLWKAHGPFAVTVRADIADDIDARGNVVLPGPRTLAPLLPAGANVTDLGNVAGSFAAKIGSEEDRPVEVTLDLGATAWIDTAMARVRLRGGGVTVDTLALAVESIRMTTTGTVSPQLLDLSARVGIDDAVFLNRFAPGIPPLELAFDAAVTGTPADPEISADLAATVDGIDVVGRARVGAGGADISLRAPAGLTTPYAFFDVAEITLVNGNAGARLLPADVTVNLLGEGVAIYHAASIGDSDGVTIAGDTLGISIGGRDLRTRRPFTVRVRPQPGQIMVSGFDMAGTLGTLSLDASLSSDSAVAAADVSVQMPAKPASLALPDNYWPGSATARLRAHAGGRIDADIHIGGITLADGSRPDVNIGFESTGQEVTVLAAVTDENALLLKASGRIPAVVSLAPLAFRAGQGSAGIEMHANDVPLAVRTDGDDDRRVMRVSGDARITGTTSAPAGTVSAAVTFPDWPKLSGYRATLEGSVGAGTGDDAIDASFRLLRDGAEQLSASLAYQGALSLTPPFVPDDGDGRVEIRARSQPIALGEFDALLPADVSMSGTLSLQLDAQGPTRNPELDGRIDVSAVELTVQQRVRMLSNGTVTISGDLANPVGRGDLVIESGVIRIPDPPKALHPTSGTALLLDQRVAAADTVPAPTEPDRPQPMRGDIDVTVAIPGALWIRGQGLEVELSGDLRIRAQDTLPALTGQLRAVRGSLVLLGRSFELERGTVVFYGDAEANPTLDVQLSTVIDGVSVTVVIAGTAAEPDLTLRSSPEMEEGDIMSYLVFGRPLDNLDQDQKSLVETRATEIAAAMGAARLQDQLREQLGVDMVAIRSASANEESSALVVGKYLNPRLLIKYERLLEEQAAQFINIEYFLTRRLKIETLYGRHDQQGIEIEWSNEY